MWYIQRYKSNHMVPVDHVKGSPNTIGLSIDEMVYEFGESEDMKTWVDTGLEICWETDTIQDYHMIIIDGQLVPDPNFIIKQIPENI